MISSSRSVSRDASSPSESTEVRMDIMLSQLLRLSHRMESSLTIVRSTKLTDTTRSSQNSQIHSGDLSNNRVPSSRQHSLAVVSSVSIGDMMDQISTSWRSTRSQDSPQVLSFRRCGKKQGKRRENLWRCWDFREKFVTFRKIDTIVTPNISILINKI
jgi:hypothetical protein